MRAKYVDSGKVTSEGAVIYNRLTGNKGRPARFTKCSNRYVAYKTPKTVTVAAVAEPA